MKPSQLSLFPDSKQQRRKDRWKKRQLEGKKQCAKLLAQLKVGKK